MNRIAKRLDPRLDEITHFHELTEAESKGLDDMDEALADMESNMSLAGRPRRTLRDGKPGSA